MGVDPVTFVVRHQVRTDQRDAYEQWLSRIVPHARRYPGHQGVSVVRPAPPGDVYTIVVHFRDLEALQQWVDSDDRHRLIAEVHPLLARTEDTAVETSPEFWFTPPSAHFRPPARWKQFVMSLSVIYPLSLVVPALWDPLLVATAQSSPGWLKSALVSSTVVFAVVYLIMPRYTRLLARWLHRT